MKMVRRLRAHYGAGPLHLLGLLTSFAITGIAVSGWFQRPRDVFSVLVWFAAAIAIHDLVLMPLYSLLDRVALSAFRVRVQTRRRSAARIVDPTPYVRVPAILSGLLLAVFFPLIFGLGTATELSASGISESGYPGRWLLASGVMFALSGLAYAARVTRARRGARTAPDQPTTSRRPDAPASD